MMEADNLPIVTDINESDYDHVQEDKEELSVDEILLKTGPFGRYQFLILSFSMIASLGYSFQTLITYYVADDCPWVCTNDNISNFCSNGPFKEGTHLFNKRCTIPKYDWRYLYQKKYSIVTEFDLVCSKEYLKALVTACFFMGCCIGSLVAGPLSDSFGRKPVIIMGFILSFLASLAGYFVAATWEYLALRALIGFAFGQQVTAVYIYLSENNPPKTRGWVGNVYFCAFTIAMLIISLVSYYVPYWRKLVLYTSFFPLFGLSLSFFLYESPHWLVVKGKHKQAVQVLEKIGRINKKTKKFILQAHKTEDITEKKLYSYIDLINNRKVFILTTVQCYLWFIGGLGFYAIALEASNLGGNLYTNFVLSSLADLPACLICLVVSVYVSRKKSYFILTFIGATLCGIIGFISESFVVIRIALAIFSRVFLAASFNLTFLWSFEINPTVVRTQGMNIGQFFSRLGSIAAPFFTSVLQDRDPKLPFFIIAAICLLGAFISTVLPETINKPTREDYKDFFEAETVNVSPPTAINEK